MYLVCRALLPFIGINDSRLYASIVNGHITAIYVQPEKLIQEWMSIKPAIVIEAICILANV